MLTRTDQSTSGEAGITTTNFGPVFIPRIESLRGMAALMVATFHAWQSSWIEAGHRRTLLALDQGGGDAIAGLTTAILRTLGNGWGAVNVFFVISGFVLALSLARGPRDFVPSGTRFVVARLLRIYPAVFATIILFALVYWTTGGALTGPDAYEVTALIRNGFLLSTEIDGVMWSLQIELIAVPLIFAAFMMYRCWGTAPLVILLASLAAMSFWGPWSHLLGRSIPLGILFSFIAGMVAFTSGRICVQHVPSNLQPQLFVGAVLLFFLSRPLLGFASHWSVIAEVYASTVMVSLLTFGAIGKFGKMFDSKSARFYGRISYSLYILHPLTLIVIWHIPDAIAAALAAGVPYLVVAALLPVLSIAAITPLAWAMWRFVERPGIEAGRWLNTRIVGTKAKPKIEPIPFLSA